KQAVALAAFSPFDLSHVSGLLPTTEARVMVLSRVFVFDWAPRNCVSYLLAKARSWIEEEVPSTAMLLTYVNPNVGFTGASYRASGWVSFAEEEPTVYAYVDGLYTTERALVQRFGTSQPAELSALLGARFETSRMR